MFLSPSDLGEQTELRCEVCIIGSGAAGITLARELAGRRIDTICVSGGSAKAQTADQDLYRGDVPNFSAHEPLETNRTRAFGGSTTVWGGRLVPFDPIDFETRDFLPQSGWPISYRDVARYIPQAAALCESRHAEYEVPVESNSSDLPATLRHGIVTNRCERWSMPTNFAERYSAELAQSDAVRVLIGQHCIDVVLDESRSHVLSVVMQSRGRAPRRIRAKMFVLACGGLENARLLLASRRQMRCGIGNQNDMVGRCYMGHIAGTHGYLRLNMRRLPNFYRLMQDEHGMYSRRRFWLAEETQRMRQLMNIVAYPFRPSPEDPQHGDSALSLLYLAQLVSTRNSRVESSTVARHLRNVMFASPSAWANAARQCWGRLQGMPRLPFLLPYDRKNLDALYFQSEHAPNRDSRVVLSDRVDEFGMPRLEPRIAFSEIDATTVVQFYAILDRSLRELELGRIEYTEPELRDYLGQIMQNYCSLAHHIGTTRMSANPSDGVVDCDCRVHGIHNLYIAGSSVFATSGHANPTLTILALTLRLADCLAAARSEQRFDAKTSVA